MGATLPLTTVEALSREISDHTPILLNGEGGGEDSTAFQI
jgi:hypothetical protein